MRTTLLAVLAGVPVAVSACGPATRTAADEPAPAAERFAAYEGRYAMLSTWTGAEGRAARETGTMDLWVEPDGTVRMTVALGDDDAPEGWSELREDPVSGRVDWATVTGRFEPSFAVWSGRALGDGTIEMRRMPDEVGGSVETVEALFSFPDGDTVRLLLTARHAGGSTGCTEDYVFRRTGRTERRWAPIAPLPVPGAGDIPE
jgi:hypothetical protein